METPTRWLFLGAMVAGLLCGHATLRAQPAGDRDPAGGEPGPAGGEPALAGNDPVVIDDPDKPWNVGISLEDREAARNVFMEGNRLFRIPLFGRAADMYMAALKKWKHPAFYFNLALAQLNLGQEVEVRESLEKALAYGEEPLGAAEHREARRQLEELERKLGRIRVICRTRGAEVTLDGTMLFTGPGQYEGWIKAKPHELTAKKVGYQSDARRVVVPAGKLLDVDLSLVTLTQAADVSRRWSIWKPWAVAGAGAAIAAASGVLHALAVRDFNNFDAEFSELLCARDQGCNQDEVDAGLNRKLARARQRQDIARAGYAAGGALVATSVVLLYLNRPRLAEGSTASARTAVVTPAVSRDMFGIQLSLSH